MLMNVYSCLSKFTTVYLYLPMFTCACLLVFTHFKRIYLLLHLLTYVYPCLLVLTYVYLCLLVFTYVYNCLLKLVYLCLPIIIIRNIALHLKSDHFYSQILNGHFCTHIVYPSQIWLLMKHMNL